MEKRPLILVTNDDSVEAPGLHFLIDIAREMGDVVAVAPAEPQSGKSSALTVNQAMRCTLADRYSSDEIPVYAVTGTPVDCVKLAMHAVLDRKPDLVLSGINHGSNAAVNIIYSGTMGAVLEGCMLGIPSVGFSILTHSLQADFSAARPFIREITREVIAGGLPHDVCLNVNIPARCTPKGVKVVRSAHGYWTEEFKNYLDPNGKPFYWLTGRFHNEEPDNPETDEYWLAREYVTVVPARPDQTAFDSLAPLSPRFSR